MAFASGLHPWEFYEYTLDELLLRLRGINEKRSLELKQLYQHVRMAAYYSLLPHLTPGAKKKSIDEIIPDIYEPVEKKVVSMKEWYAKTKEKYIKYGLLNGN
jgi:hypothetical protein